MLLLHGLTGNPVSLRPLAEELAAEGYTVELPLLPGHGTHWRDLAHTDHRDWTGAAEHALARLRAHTREQVVVGLSMGGTLALWLAGHAAADLAGLVCINPSLRVEDPRLALLPLLARTPLSLPGLGNDIARPDADEQPYPRVPVRALTSLIALQKETRSALPRVQAPLLVMVSRMDHVVPPRNGVLAAEQVAGSHVELVWLERSYHVATLDYDAAEVGARTAAFVARVAGAPART